MTVSFKPEYCTGCGLCEVTCPKSAINVIKTVSGYHADIEGCIDCGVCTVYCQYGALTLETSPFSQILDRIKYSKTEVNFENCVFCGKCAENCPRGAIDVEKRLEKDRVRLGYVRIGEGCIQCRNCVMFCPTDAVRIVRGRPEIDESKCIYCQICQGVCPKDVIEIHCDSCKVKFEYAVSGHVDVDIGCSLCGTCEEVCEFDAIHVNRIFEGEQSFDGDRCLGDECTICINVCPNSAISYEYGAGKIVAFDDSCNFCGKCEKYCPGNAIEIERFVSERYEEIHLPGKISDYHEIHPVIEVSSKCIGCHFCESVCKIAKEINLSEVRGEVEPESCTACGLCESVCPMDAIVVREKL
ncbi:4Fe-4S binding protein [Geoglobus acetivorans]|uniref:4Fe-4S binding protein n=1 Tax=Geoglobus acetivorans TaxID=565033 RepID=UPI00064E892D